MEEKRKTLDEDDAYDYTLQNALDELYPELRNIRGTDEYVRDKSRRHKSYFGHTSAEYHHVARWLRRKLNLGPNDPLPQRLLQQTLKATYPYVTQTGLGRIQDEDTGGTSSQDNTTSTEETSTPTPSPTPSITPASLRFLSTIFCSSLRSSL